MGLGGLLLAVFAMAGVGGVSSAAPPPATVPAGFDCGKATRAIDRFICADATLRWQDLALSRTYRAARDAASGPARAALLATQRDWLVERDCRCVGDRTFAQLTAPSAGLREPARLCLMTVYLDRRRALVDGVAAPIATQAVREIDLRPIVRARPELVADDQVPITAMRLAPDGKHVAILLPSQDLDLPDQLWLYRVADGKLVPATPRPHRGAPPYPDGAVAAIKALAWQGDTIFVRVALWGGSGDGEEGTTAIYKASIKGSQRVRDPSGALDGRFQPISTDLAVDDEALATDDAVIEPVQGNDAFLVWAADHGHATIDLHVRPRAPGAVSYLVGWGGWELAHFVIDDPRSRLVYAADTGVSLLDMATRVERRIAGTARGDRPYAMAADRGTILWSTHNRCGDETLSGPDIAAPERFCIAAIADNR